MTVTFETDSGATRNSLRRVVSIALVCCGATLANAAESPVREISPGVLQIGAVRIEKSERRLSFDADVNMAEGEIEYVLVTKSGKTHESVFATTAEPQHIHLAALLLGIRDATKFPPTATNTPAALRGDPVRIAVTWTRDGHERTVPVEEFVRHAETRRPLAHGPWIYNGSTLWEGRFIAQTEGSIIAVMDDRDALVNNPRPGREDDKIWRVNEKIAPPKGTRVRIAISAEAGKQSTVGIEKAK